MPFCVHFRSVKKFFFLSDDVALEKILFNCISHGFEVERSVICFFGCQFVVGTLVVVIVLRRFSKPQKMRRKNFQIIIGVLFWEDVAELRYWMLEFRFNRMYFHISTGIAGGCTKHSALVCVAWRIPSSVSNLPRIRHFVPFVRDLSTAYYWWWGCPSGYRPVSAA